MHLFRSEKGEGKPDRSGILVVSPSLLIFDPTEGLLHRPPSPCSVFCTNRLLFSILLLEKVSCEVCPLDG